MQQNKHVVQGSVILAANGNQLLLQVNYMNICKALQSSNIHRVFTSNSSKSKIHPYFIWSEKSAEWTSSKPQWYRLPETRPVTEYRVQQLCRQMRPKELSRGIEIVYIPFPNNIEQLLINLQLFLEFSKFCPLPLPKRPKKAIQQPCRYSSGHRSEKSIQ
jgi:hypothetical protein